ncbi:hypothetical protein K8I61_14845 [bacterium]|nr:hypothetical protein [bacterium]
MNRNYLGDALDFWKRAMFAYLREKGAIRNLQVVPMFPRTSEATETDELKIAYARILGVSPSNILEAGEKPIGDVFIDPDTGVAAGTASRKHVSARVCHDFLSKEPSNVVMVYQHAARETDWCETRLNILRGGDIPACAYHGTGVALLFLSNDASRIESICVALSELLGSAAAARLIKGGELTASSGAGPDPSLRSG